LHAYKFTKTHNITFLTHHHNRAITTNSSRSSHFKININLDMHRILNNQSSIQFQHYPIKYQIALKIN